MSDVDAIKFFGKKKYNEMIKTNLLTGITCKIGENGKLIIYGCDLWNAYQATYTNKAEFVD